MIRAADRSREESAADPEESLLESHPREGEENPGGVDSAVFLRVFCFFPVLQLSKETSPFLV